MDSLDLKKESLALMERLSFVGLTTIDAKGFPSTRAMMNLRNKQKFASLVPIHEAEFNPLTVYLTTNTSSEKITEIIHHPYACLYYCDTPNFQGVTLQGVIEIVTDKDFRRRVWQKGWEIYYPKGDDDYSVLRFIPSKLKIYANFSVHTLEL